MGTLSPKAFAELYAEMLAEGRKNGFGMMKNSPEFIRRIDLEYDTQFGKESSPKVKK